MSVVVDSKLNTTPLVRLQRPSKTFVDFLCFVY